MKIQLLKDFKYEKVINRFEREPKPIVFRKSDVPKPQPVINNKFNRVV